MVKNKKSEQIHARVTIELKNKIQAIANKENKPMNQVLIDSLVQYLENKGI